MHGVLKDLNRAALKQGVDLVVIKELLSHADIDVTADAYAHVRLRPQRQAIDAMGTPSATRTTILTTHPPQPSSADVAVKTAEPSSTSLSMRARVRFQGSESSAERVSFSEEPKFIKAAAHPSH
ncbi:hypothetical protein [Amycolatopsis coloradensis]|uniref:hypothetical protein n=1 Tax=Amycolatopsis coloradensis TaxID=76021 RepID=UPI001ABFBA2F|nr:hypothetical protein [Amycolatopsis coloradensis]